MVQQSLSARRAWIEMYPQEQHDSASSVALRKESVDRNFHVLIMIHNSLVALRKESVDRNIWQFRKASKESQVALRKESVDRNIRRCSIWVLQS